MSRTVTAVVSRISSIWVETVIGDNYYRHR
jgi:hypothetical protein